MTKLHDVPWEFIGLESARDLDPSPAIEGKNLGNELM